MTKPELPLVDQHDFASGVMHKIETDHITAHHRLWFVARDLSFWGLWFVSALIGAFALSATIFVFQSSSWRLYLVTHDSFLDYLTDVMPYVWLLLFVIMCSLAYLNFRHTSKGYRRSLLWLIALNLSVTVMLAALISVAGWGKFVDEQVGQHIPLYSTISRKQELQWFKPEQGLLIGQVTEINRPLSQFVLRAPNNADFALDGHLLTEAEWQLIEVRAIKLRVVGVPKAEAPFVACLVFPVFPRGVQVAEFDYAERNFRELRSSECKGVRPYDRFDRHNLK